MKSRFTTEKFNKLLSVLIIGLVCLLINSCKEKPLSTVSNITVSQGTYIGIVHVTWDPIPGAQYYNIERQGSDGQWMSAGTVAESPFDDYGFGLPDNKLQEGVKYSYRIVSGSSDKDDSGYANATTQGWIYEIKPITLTATREDNGYVTLTWSDPNQDLLSVNLVGFSYKIKRKYEDQTEFTDIFTTDNMGTVQDITYTDNTVANDKKATYSVEGVYDYGYKNMDYGDFVEYWYNQFAGVEETGGSLKVNYTVTDINPLPDATDGYGYVSLKSINSVLYAATIPHPAFGAPAIYKLNGNSWQNISSSYPAGLQGNFNKISICGDGTTLWVAGVSDSAYVYSFNGTWSSNLASKNLGFADVPDNLLVEYINNKLYALCDHDNKIEILTHGQGSEWTSASVL
ncbi:MAG TPA: hypothetical protein VJ963_15410, partial [Bacteroidales bacterium]|nr:hypothetical protein [Bacteroidales bacterium]